MNYQGGLGRREGFALVAVLWVMASIAVIGASLTVTAQQSVGTAQNRVDLSRAAWRAEGCAEAARSVIDEALASDAGRPSATTSWSQLDVIVVRSPLLAGCGITLRPSGTTIDISDADSSHIRAVLTAIGKTSEQADSLVDALLDWRDADTIPRSRGAENRWYRSQSRPGPRNGPLASVDELRMVRGFDRIGGLDTLFGTESERIDLNDAPLAVLATLPGFDADVLAFIAADRLRAGSPCALDCLAAGLPPTTRARLLSHYAELVRLTTSTPEAWTLTSRAAVGTPPLAATVELRLVKAGTRAAIVRRRSWP